MLRPRYRLRFTPYKHGEPIDLSDPHYQFYDHHEAQAKATELNRSHSPAWNGWFWVKTITQPYD